tara:strand:+ start:1767 stop:2615 length:849 start_codon:yes stop_codon:yes gene_type:complete
MSKELNRCNFVFIRNIRKSMKRIIFIGTVLFAGIVPTSSDDRSEHQRKVEAEIHNSVLRLTVKEGGEINTYEVELKDVVELDAIKSLVDDLDIDIHLDSIFDNYYPKSYEGVTFLGVNCEDISDQLRKYFKVKSDVGVLISEVVEDSPAEGAGLKAGDVIVAINKDEIWDSQDLITTVREYEPEDEIKVKVIRKGRVKTIDIALGERSKASHVEFRSRFADYYFNKKKRVEKFRKPNFDGEFEEDFFILDDDLLRKELNELKEEIESLKNELKKNKQKQTSY